MAGRWQDLVGLPTQQFRQSGFMLLRLAFVFLLSRFCARGRRRAYGFARRSFHRRGGPKWFLREGEFWVPTGGRHFQTEKYEEAVVETQGRPLVSGAEGFSAEKMTKICEINHFLKLQDVGTS